MSARGTAAAVRAGQRSAREVTEEALAAVEARDGETRAFLEVLADNALAEAAAVDAAVAEGRDPGPLAGVPVALKDNLCTRGIPTTCASKILDGWRPPYDATVVTTAACRRCDRAGQDEHGRVRHGQLDGELRLRSDPQSAPTPTRCRAGAAAARPRPWQPGSPRSRSARTPEDRSVNPPRCAGSSA